MSFQDYSSRLPSKNEIQYKRSSSVERCITTTSNFLTSPHYPNKKSPEFLTKNSYSPSLEGKQQQPSVTGMDRYRLKYMNKNNSPGPLSPPILQKKSHLQMSPNNRHLIHSGSGPLPVSSIFDDRRNDVEDIPLRNTNDIRTSPQISYPTSNLATIHGSFMKQSSSNPNDMFTRLRGEISIYQTKVNDFGKQKQELESTSLSLPKKEFIMKEQEETLNQISQHGEQIQKILLSQEASIQQLSRSEAISARTSHMQLIRTFRQTQSTLKAHQLDFKNYKAKQNYGGMNGITYSSLHNRMSNSMTDNNNNTYSGNAKESDYDLHLRQMEQEHEEEYALGVMREREESIADINRKMHHVNEIYKDLGNIVESQQTQIDTVEKTMEDSQHYTRQGLEHLQVANGNQAVKASSQYTLPHGIPAQPPQPNKNANANANANANQEEPNQSQACGFMLAFDTSKMGQSLKGMGSQFISIGNQIWSCGGVGDGGRNENEASHFAPHV